MSMILLVQVDPVTVALLRDDTGLPAETRIEEVADPKQAIARLRARAGMVDFIVLGARLEEPIQIAQRLYAIDKDMGLLILTDPEYYEHTVRALQFAPFLGGEIRCYPTTERERLAPLIKEMVMHARQRRRHRTTVAAANARLTQDFPVHPHVARSLDRLLELAPIGVVMTDAQGAVLAWNRMAGEILGKREREVLGRSLLDLFPHEQRRALNDFIREARVAEPPLSSTVFKRRQPDGQPQFLEVRAAALAGRSGEEGALLLLQDVTARVLADQERERARQHAEFLSQVTTLLTSSLDYETTLSNIAHLAVPILADWCAVDVVEEDGSIYRLALTHRDPAKEKLLTTLQQRYPLAWNSPQPAVQALRTGKPCLIPVVTEAIRRSHVVNSEHERLIERLGTLSAIAVPLIAREHIAGAMTFCAETAGRYRVEDIAFFEELARRAAIAVDNARLYRQAQQAIQIRDQFLSLASHELRTPVTTIQGYSEVLQRRAEREGGLPPTLARGINTIHQQAKRLGRLVDVMLDLSRLQLGSLAIERAPLDLVALVRSQVEMMQPMLERHTLAFFCDEGPYLLEGDELRLGQVLHNLIDNAVKYSPEGGVVTVRLRREDDVAWVSVSDQGIGIPEASLEHLFNLFYRAGNVNAQQIGGLGLGLYVVNEVVRAHGGTVEVESREGEGTTFTVSLPLLEPSLVSEGRGG